MVSIGDLFPWLEPKITDLFLASIALHVKTYAEPSALEIAPASLTGKTNQVLVVQ
jgi:hypothetical protein